MSGRGAIYPDVAMAGRHFSFGTNGGDAERFFRSMAPAQLLTATNQVVSLMSMAPSDLASVPAEVDGILKDEIGWMERTVKNGSDSKAASEGLGRNLGEGLDLGEDEPDADDEVAETDLATFQASGAFTKGARFNVRQALYYCWIALPDGRRTPAEVERIVRLAVSRQLAAVEELRREILQS